MRSKGFINMANAAHLCATNSIAAVKKGQSESSGGGGASIPAESGGAFPESVGGGGAERLEPMAGGWRSS